MNAPPKRRSNINDWRIFQFILLIGLSLGLLFPLLSSGHILEISCAFTAHSSVPCPSCGLSRAWHYLYDGDFVAARQTNANAYRLLILLLSQVIWRSLIIVRSGGGKALIIWDIVITGISVIVLAGPYLLDLMRFITYA